MIKPSPLLILGLAAFLAAAPARAQNMSFTLTTLGGRQCGAHCPQVIAADGEIVEETPDAFVSFVRRRGASPQLRSIMLLNSPGGKVFASMALGHALRKLGMAVIVARVAPDTERNGALAAARCYSACVYALMGGRKRVIPPQSSVGVHRMFNYSTSLSPAGDYLVRKRVYDHGGMGAMLSRYALMMGISSDLIAYAERTSPDRLHVLTASEIARWRLGSPRL
ncbi:MAG: hypothetical protein HYS06_13220 [Methylocystis sp.]|nr:hypothetical protein [Methylocystis sp.]MBI3274946.1 hypothetical protein [Methylocystis sp.]